MKYLIKRVRNTLEATVINAENEEKAIELARKVKLSEWKTLDNKRRKNYTAEAVSTKGN